MRIVPLIPLACLGLGAALVETIARAPSDKATRDFGIEIGSASVATSTVDFQTRFQAVRLNLDPAGGTAEGVFGEMVHGQGRQSFSSDAMSSIPGAGGFLLEGNVRMWSDEGAVWTDRATVSPDGAVSGGKVRVEVGGNEMAADGFSLAPGGDLALEGKVRGTLGN